MLVFYCLKGNYALEVLTSQCSWDHSLQLFIWLRLTESLSVIPAVAAWECRDWLKHPECTGSFFKGQAWMQHKSNTFIFLSVFRWTIFQYQPCMGKPWRPDFIFIHTTAWTVYWGQWGAHTPPVCYSERLSLLLTQHFSLQAPKAAGCKLLNCERCTKRWLMFTLAVHSLHTKQTFHCTVWELDCQRGAGMGR